MSDTDYKVPVGLSLPQSVIEALDAKRGHLARSAYVLSLLERTLDVSSLPPTLLRIPPEPVKPSQDRELLQKRESELQDQLTKAANDERAGLQGSDPTPVMNAKQIQSAILPMLNLVRNGLKQWETYNKQLADFNEATKKVSSIEPWIKEPPLCELGHPTKFGGIRNWRGLGFNGDGWLTIPDVQFKLRFICSDCNGEYLKTIVDLEKLKTVPKPKPDTKKPMRWEGHERAVSRGATK